MSAVPEVPTPAQVTANRAALPRVQAVCPLGPGRVRLTLNTGAALTLEDGRRASLAPAGADGLHVLYYEWGRPDGAVYAVPAHLYAALLPYFPHGGGRA